MRGRQEQRETERGGGIKKKKRYKEKQRMPSMIDRTMKLLRQREGEREGWRQL